MTVYLDSNFRCHAQPAEGLRAVEAPFFKGKCRRFIEGFRYVPAGEFWTREDGAIFRGEMVSPAENYTVLAAAQAQYEETLAEMQDMQTALHTLEVEVDG